MGFFGVRDEIIALFVKVILFNIIKDLVTYSIFHFSWNFFQSRGLCLRLVLLGFFVSLFLKPPANGGGLKSWFFFH